LNRQFLFQEDDIGLKKVDILETRLKKINSTLNVKKIESNLEQVNLQNENISLIILSADSDNSLIKMTKLATTKKIPLISVGYLADISCIGPFYLPERSSCPMCNNIYTDIDNDIDLPFRTLRRTFLN